MSEEPRRKSHGMTWTFFLVVTPVLYVLSIGPAFYLAGSEILPIPFNWITTFYLPVLWLRDHTPLWELLNAYLEWWLPMKGL